MFPIVESTFNEARKCVIGSFKFLNPATLPAISVEFLVWPLRATLESVCHNCDEYEGLWDDEGGTEGKKTFNSHGMHILLEQSFFGHRPGITMMWRKWYSMWQGHCYRPES